MFGKLGTNLDSLRSFSWILFTFHHSWKWVSFEPSLYWEADRVTNSENARQSFFVLTWSINFLAQYFSPDSNFSRKTAGTRLDTKWKRNRVETKACGNWHVVINKQFPLLCLALFWRLLITVHKAFKSCFFKSFQIFRMSAKSRSSLQVQWAIPQTQPRPQGFLLDDFQNGGSSGEDLCTVAVMSWSCGKHVLWRNRIYCANHIMGSI